MKTFKEFKQDLPNTFQEEIFFENFSSDELINVLLDECSSERVINMTFDELDRRGVLDEEICFGDMSDSLLETIAYSESSSDYDRINSIVTLYERSLIDLSEEELKDLLEAPLTAFGTAGEKVEFGRNRVAKDLQQSKQMSKLAQSSPSAPRGVSGPTAKSMLPTSVQSVDKAAKPVATAGTSSGPKPLTSGGSARANVEAGRAAFAKKADTLKNVSKMGQSSLSVNQAKAAQAGLDKAIGSTAKTSIKSALSSAGSTAMKYGKNLLGGVSKLAGRATAPLAALTTGYQVGSALNSIPAVNKQTSKVGKAVADSIGSNKEVNKAISRPANYVPQRLLDMQKNKVNDTTKSASMPIKKSIPKAIPKAAPKSSSGSFDSNAIADIKKSASNLSAATKDLTGKTSSAVAATKKLSSSIKSTPVVNQNAARQNKSISTKKSVPNSVPTAKVGGGAPTTAVGSKPPPLSSKNASGGKWM